VFTRVFIVVAFSACLGSCDLLWLRGIPVTVRAGGFPDSVEASLIDRGFSPKRIPFNDGLNSVLEKQPPEGTRRAYLTADKSAEAEIVIVHATGLGLSPTRQHRALVRDFFVCVSECLVKSCGRG
jgi:hypothetical protein